MGTKIWVPTTYPPIRAEVKRRGLWVVTCLCGFAPPGYKDQVRALNMAVEHVRREHRYFGSPQILDRYREIARQLDERGYVALCENCIEPLRWNLGNGGQWLGALPPRDWMTCFGRPTGQRHIARYIMRDQLTRSRSIGSLVPVRISLAGPIEN